MGADRTFAGYREEALEVLPRTNSDHPNLDEDDFLEVELPYELSSSLRADLVRVLDLHFASAGEAAYATGIRRFVEDEAEPEDGSVVAALRMPELITILARGTQVVGSLLDNPLVKVLEAFLQNQGVKGTRGWIDEDDLVLMSQYRLASRYNLNVDALALIDIEVSVDQRGSVRFSDTDGVRYEVSYEASKGGLEVTRFRRSLLPSKPGVP